MLDEIVRSLLYEGYALYPYTPGATKNATPTPFGIVYPPAYAAASTATFDHARMQCLLAADADRAPRLSAEVWFLRPSGERHQAEETHVELEGAALGESVRKEFAGGRLTLFSERLGDRVRVTCGVQNTLDVPVDLDRAQALRSALISTHIVVHTSEGKFVSPLESESAAVCESVNTFPVLATPDDDAVLGAAIVLPEHPQIAPESLGALFDNTEIEEALLLHVHALSDGEREQISGQDPAVREMLQRALESTPEDIIALHGRFEEVSHGATPMRSAGDDLPIALQMNAAGEIVPMEMPMGGADDNPGEEQATVDGVTYAKGGKVRLAPGTHRGTHDRLLHGRVATLERIYVDMDDRVHLAVTVDDDPGQQLFRNTGRYLFFFANEVEPLA
jgi:hypothetical protein